MPPGSLLFSPSAPSSRTSFCPAGRSFATTEDHSVASPDSRFRWMATMGRGLDEKDIPSEIARLTALLQGGRPPRPCQLTTKQLESLAAFCDALIPSTEVPGGAASDEDLARFYSTSASMATVPEHVSMKKTPYGDKVYLLILLLRYQEEPLFPHPPVFEVFSW